MIVMKFGGTSVGSAERIRSLAERVAERIERRPVVVVSALAGVTDMLLRGAEAALARDPRHAEGLTQVRDRHRAVLAELLPAGAEREALSATIDALTGELAALHTGIFHLGELTARSRDAVASMGERLSYPLVAAALTARGVAARAVDARQVVITDEDFGRAQPLPGEVERRAAEEVRPLLDRGLVPVLAGFIGATRKGITTTLGRGGSDWSAALLGAALGAEEIQVWTDVDGMMTVDPRVVAGAKVIREVSFEEAAELAYFGAKVLHPATIRPAVDRAIPVRILNSLRPEAPGTVVTAAPGDARPGEPRAIAFKRGSSVILISQPRMLMAYGFVARVFEAFDRHRTPVDLIATSEVSISLTVDDASRLEALERDLSALGEVTVLRDMAIVSVVGRGFVGQAGLAARIFQALGDVNVVMISFGASDVNVSFVVAGGDAERAVRRLHGAFFEG
ncbi:MAG TPA: lysine-sensitive aspartokinase 3 [Vicinamibacteria bacterium]|nr:lysine-sensitive aspartokinase 3 [Vicinamibacteria bacterium]